ncbi:SMP-30/gluconolactonase/LRE family protein [Aquabacterium sp.]|uniref:SMP-30/gluconolactonase/LRE family protein n=1 Tax=Aquabacterium sp. TaxID=1872578 RepID=UPI003D6CB3AE
MQGFTGKCVGLSVRWACRVWGVLALGGLPLAGQVHAADSGLPVCAGVGVASVMVSGQGPLESIAFDQQGRILFTRLFKGELVRLDSPQGAPVTVAVGVDSPGGIAVSGPHEAYVGVGNGLAGVAPSLGKAGIVKVDLDKGRVTPHVSGLSMSNGMVRATDGTFYASDDLAASLDRVLPDGTVQRTWLKQNSNGLALSRDQKTLYVNQMVPASILAVDRATGQTSVVANAPPARKWSWLDGLDIDDQGRLYVVSYWAGEVWRLDPASRQICLLVSGLSLPSAVAVGRPGGAYRASSIYVTTHSGRLHEVPGAVPAAP